MHFLRGPILVSRTAPALVHGNPSSGPMINAIFLSFISFGMSCPSNQRVQVFDRG